MEIKQIREKIKKNYSELFHKRKVNSKPVFSIEHNLTKEECKFLNEYIQLSVIVYQEDELLWLVYASEIGYKIDRIEYWDSFQKNLRADFDNNDNRNKIRTFFNNFINNYNGYKPQGTFAEHFTIISFPIYNSILPKYLQSNLAQLLFICRHSFQDFKNKDYIKFGNFLSRQIYNYNFSKLFYKFSEDKEMLGKIAYALIDESADNKFNDIQKNTFDRIIADCEEARETKDWLKSTRSTYKKVKFQGLRKNISNIFLNKQKNEAKKILNDCFIKPQIHLIKEYNAWKTYIRFESFEKNFLKIYPEFREVFRNTYCVINGDEDKTINAKNFLRKNNEILLNKWIEFNKRLIEFKSDHESSLISQLNFTLQNESFLIDEKIWLFKVSEFSHAKEIVGKTILPNTDYLIVSKENQSNKLLKESNISTENVYAYTFSTKNTFTKEDIESFKDLNLYPYSKIVFKPIGYPPQNFNEEEASSWNIGDKPCFKIETDQTIEKIIFTFMGEKIQKHNVNEDLYIKLDVNELGSYSLNAHAEVKNYKQDIISGTHDIKIHDKNIWDKSQIGSDVFYIETDPINPSLDNLIANDMDLEINGPRNLKLELKIIINKEDDEILIFDNFPKLKTPVEIHHWYAYFEDNILNNKNTKIYEELVLSKNTIFEFTSEDIGRTKITLEHEIKPLQLRYISESLFLIDNSGDQPTNQINYIKFDTPDFLESKIVKNKKVHDINNGGLFFSSNKSNEETFLIIPRIFKDKITLEQLIPPKMKLKKAIRDEKWIFNYIYYYRLWCNAKIVSNRSIIHNWVKGILYELSSNISYCLCFDRNNHGNKFSINDRKYRNLIKNNKKEDAKKLLPILLSSISNNTNENAFLIKLSNSFDELDISQKIDKLLEYFKKIKRIEINQLEIEFALLLNFAPEILLKKYLNFFNAHIKKILRKPEIYKTIRYLILFDLLKDNASYNGLRPFGKNWKWV